MMKHAGLLNNGGALMDELEERLMRIASEEGLLMPREPNSGTVKQMEPFMEKHGFVNANGWWVRPEWINQKSK